MSKTETEKMERRVARVQALCERWAENLESNAEGLGDLRAAALRSHAETCREIAGILSGAEDDYLAYLEGRAS